MGANMDESDGNADYAGAAARIMARSALAQGVLADQLAGDAAAEQGLRRTRALTDALGRPQDSLTIVHVAGTKGKGSTVAFISSILVAAGVRTGRLTSPHLARLTERITIDERDIDDETFVAITDLVLSRVETLERDRPELGRCNVLEVLFATALVAFREAGCRVAVIEVGIGGRLDTTNIVDPAVSVITTLDLEHTAILGDTLAEIAFEKAGIVKPGRPVIVAPQPAIALDVIRQRAAASGSRLLVIGNEEGTADERRIGLAGPHQRGNAALAVAALRELGSLDPGLTADSDAIRSGLARAWLPGRFEVVPPDAVRLLAGVDASGAVPVVVLDGAHTPRAAAALRETLDTTVVSQSGALLALCGFAADKDIRAFLGALRPDRVQPVAAASPRAVPTLAISGIAADLGIVVMEGPDTVGPALRRVVRDEAMTGESPLATVVVTGSFIVVAEARAALGLSDRHDE
jgi:dihydrofolate synthase/folylpolyglutamate synthase